VQIYRLCVYTEHPDHKTLGFLIAALRDLLFWSTKHLSVRFSSGVIVEKGGLGTYARPGPSSAST